MRKTLFFYFIIFLTASSCVKKISYDYQSNLESFIKKFAHYDVTGNVDTIVLILQNEDCICTEEDIALAKSVLVSPKFATSRFIIVVSSMKHKFLKVIPESVKQRITIVDNKDRLLIDNGYVAVTDRIIIYKAGRPTYYADMHITKPKTIANQIF